MKKLVIEKDAVRENLAVVRESAESAEICAVLTGDAYGAGLVELARFLRGEGITRFAVSEPEEAEALREAGLEHEEIWMLRATTDRGELGRLIDCGAVCTVSSVETGMALNALAESRSTVAEAQLLVDVGMGFGGFLPEDSEKILSMYRNLPNVAITGIYTQLHSDQTDGRNAAIQMDAFQKLLETIREAGYETGLVHAAGSFALLHYNFAKLDAVRAGSVLLGRCRRVKGDGLRQVGYGEAVLEDVRWLPKGHTVGSEKLVTLRKPTRVAVLPVGYQNGFGVSRTRTRGLWAMLKGLRRSRRVTVRIGKASAKVIGRIGALETLLDVTHVKCSAGDTAVFEIDPQYVRGLTREYR